MISLRSLLALKVWDINVSNSNGSGNEGIDMMLVECIGERSEEIFSCNASAGQNDGLCV